MNLTRLTKTQRSQGCGYSTVRTGVVSSTSGDYVIFVDESRDACLDPIDPRFPMLNLVFCTTERPLLRPRRTQLKSKENFWHTDPSKSEMGGKLRLALRDQSIQQRG